MPAIDSTILAAETNLPSFAKVGDFIYRNEDVNSFGRLNDNPSTSGADNNIFIEDGVYAGLDWDLSSLSGENHVYRYGTVGQVKWIGIQTAGDYTPEPTWVSPDNPLVSLSGTLGTDVTLEWHGFEEIHNDYRGMADGRVNVGKYPWMIDGNWIAKISDFGNRNNLFQSRVTGTNGVIMPFVNWEITGGGFAGNQNFSNQTTSVTNHRRKTSSHAYCLIWLVNNEGFYHGSDPNEESIETTWYGNNVVLFVGGESFQASSLGEGVNITNNTFVGAGLEWRDPFQLSGQEKNTQLEYRVGDINYHRNILQVCGTTQMILIPNTTADGYTPSNTKRLSARWNVLAESRQKPLRINTGDNSTTVEFVENDLMSSENSHREGEYNDETVDHVVDIDNTDIRSSIKRNNIDLDGRSILNSANGTDTIEISNNQDVSVSAPQYLDAPFPNDFDYRRLMFYAEAYKEEAGSTGQDGYLDPIQYRDAADNLTKWGVNYPDVIIYKGVWYYVTNSFLSHDGTVGSEVKGTVILPTDTSYCSPLEWDSQNRCSFDSNFTTGETTQPKALEYICTNYKEKGALAQPRTDVTEVKWQYADSSSPADSDIKTLWGVFDWPLVKVDYPILSGKYVRVGIKARGSVMNYSSWTT